MSDAKFHEDMKELQKYFTKAVGSRSDVVVKRFKNVVFLGDCYSGKTTLINKLLGKRNGVVAPSLGLQYSFFEKESHGEEGKLQIDTFNIWEIGTSMMTRIHDFLRIPLTLPNDDTLIVIVLDLTQPKNVIRSLIVWINIVKEHLKRFNDVDDDSSSDKNVFTHVILEHIDAHTIQYIGTPLLIIANKADALDKYKPGTKDLIKAVRFISHTHCGHLTFMSSIDNKFSESFDSIQDLVVSFHKVKDNRSMRFIDGLIPLSIYAGQDKLGIILEELPSKCHRSSFINTDGTISSRSLDTWLSAMESIYGAPSSVILHDNENKKNDLIAKTELVLSPMPIIDSSIESMCSTNCYLN